MSCAIHGFRPAAIRIKLAAMPHRLRPLSRILRLAFAALLAAALPALAQQDWQPVERIAPYSVTGASGIELYRSIGERGPEVGAGRTIAHTDFELLWTRD